MVHRYRKGGLQLQLSLRLPFSNLAFRKSVLLTIHSMHKLTIIPERTIILCGSSGWSSGLACFEVTTWFFEEVGFVVLDVLGAFGGVERVEC